jgi:hypothetical protein
MPGLIASLLKCCRPSLAPCVADALVLVHSRKPGREAELLAVTRKAVAEVHARMQEIGLFESGSFVLVFPLLQFALAEASSGPEASDRAMEVLSRYADVC